MTIDEFIEIVYPKLKQDVKKTTELISGSDLLLSGQKEINDEKIIPNGNYSLHFFGEENLGLGLISTNG